MKATPMLFALSLLFACKNTGSIALDDSGSTTGDDSTVGDDSSGDDSTPPVDTGNPAEGPYALIITLSDAERGYEICSGEASVEIAEDGGLSGAGSCAIQEGPGAGTTADLSFTGDADATGTITGTVTTTLDIMGRPESTDSELSGNVAPPSMTLAWALQLGGGPNGGGPSLSGEGHTDP